MQGALSERGTLTIRRSKLPNDYFTMTPNAWARDPSLSWAARGLLTWMLSHSVGFKITEELICASGPMARDGVRTMIHSLENAGYLKRVRTSQPTGGSTVDYVLQDPSDGYSTSLDDGYSDPRPEQGEDDLFAAQPSDGKSDPRTSLPEEQEKTKTPPVSRRAPRSDRATRIPDDFQPTDQMRAWFAGENLSAVIDGRVEHEKFCDYWRAEAGARARKLDWAACWRRWMRTAAERAPRRPGNALAPISGAPYKPSTTDARISQGMALAAKYEEQGL